MKTDDRLTPRNQPTGNARKAAKADESLNLRARLATLPPDAVLTNSEAATYCGSGGSTWERMRRNGLLPRAIRLTGRTLGFRKRDLDVWLDARTERPANAA